MESLSQIELDTLATKLAVTTEQVRQAVELLEDGNTIPFITRFRRDVTGGLNESQIAEIGQVVRRAANLAERKESILKSISSRESLSPELETQIRAATSSRLLEDLYLPYKRKKETRAERARQRGLEPLAKQLLFNEFASAEDFETAAGNFVGDELKSVKEVLDSVRDLVIESFSETIDVREKLRAIFAKDAVLVSAKYVEPEEADEYSNTADAAAVVTEDPAETGTAENVDSDVDAESLNEPSEPPSTFGEGLTVDIADTATVSAVEGEATPEESANEQGEGPSSELDGTDSNSSEPITNESESGEASSPSGTGPVESKKPAKPPKFPTSVSAAEQRRIQRRLARRRKREQLEASFKNYFEFSEPVSMIPPHRILAVNRGERVRALKVRLKVDADLLQKECRPLVVPADSPHSEYLEGCFKDALNRQLVPSIEREIRRDLTEKAEQHALQVFARNLRHLLLQPTVRRRVLAVDPGLKFGCKVVALDEYGNALADTTIHAIGDADRVAEGRRRMESLINEHQLQVIAIGNGTGCRHAETTVATLLEEKFADDDISYVVVNEAGASIYSTSTLANQELPDSDARLRGAVSIGRRLLDPLSELVKIDPGNIGVGLYQHDVKQKHLQESLDDVVKSCVNYVGVNVNTASPSLLRYVSGLNQRTAREIYDYRKEHGPFKTREALKNVPGIGEATYVQAAGFLKVYGGENPLDATWVHPEHYAAAEEVLGRLNLSLDELRERLAQFLTGDGDTDGTSSTSESDVACDADPTSSGGESPPADDKLALEEASTIDDGGTASATTEGSEASAPGAAPDVEEPTTPEPGPSPSAGDSSSTDWSKIEVADPASVAAELEISPLLFEDLLTAFRKAGRDPREDFPPPLFRRGIMKLEDLTPDMELSGTVLNVVDFGAFVDIGLRDSGLIHISQLADQFIRDPHEVVSVGDILHVWVLAIDKQRRRVSLTTFPPGSPARDRKIQPEGTGQSPPRRERKSGRKPQGQGRGKKPRSHQHGKSSRRGDSSRPPRRRPKPVVPITEGMKNGTEPMRTFGDLAQFFQSARSESGPTKTKSKSGKSPAKQDSEPDSQKQDQE